MNEYDIADIIQHLLSIKKDFWKRLKHPDQFCEKDFNFYAFEQILENGGCDTLTKTITYVFIPNEKALKEENCLVYFNGKFAYNVQYSMTFWGDIKNHNLKPVTEINKYLNNESKGGKKDGL